MGEDARHIFPMNSVGVSSAQLGLQTLEDGLEHDGPCTIVKPTGAQYRCGCVTAEASLAIEQGVDVGVAAGQR